MGMEKESGFGWLTEATLIKQAQAGCQESMNLLLLRNEGLVHLVVQRQWLSTLPYDQAIQAGRQGLWRAILGFDLERKNRFSTYAYAAIMRQVWAVERLNYRHFQAAALIERARTGLETGCAEATWSKGNLCPWWRLY